MMSETAGSDTPSHNLTHLTAVTHQELTQFLGGEAPILSKIGLIVKGAKKRMILDTKESGLKHCSAKHQRVLLPRLLDAITQGLNLLSECGAEESVDWFVLDYSDAFWQVPLHPDERRFFCAKCAFGASGSS